MQLEQHFSSVSSDKLIRNLFIVLGTSILFALSAWIAIPLPFTPVPISFTCQLILMASVFLGKRGAYATLAYLGQGIIGFPVFAAGGAGIAHLFGPTGGYLIGFVVASYVLGMLADQMREKSMIKMFALMLSGNFIIYLFGVSHLSLLVGWSKAFYLGCYPFIGADILKLVLALRGLKILTK